MDQIIILGILLVVPVTVTIINVIGLKKAQNRFFNIVSIIALFVGGWLYLLLGLGKDLLTEETDLPNADIPGVILALDLIVLFIAILMAFFRSRYSDSSTLIKVIIALNIYPVIFLILPPVILLFKVFWIFPLIYHINVILTSVQAIRRVE